MVEKTELCSEQDVSEASLNEICIHYLILYCSDILRSEAKGGGFLLLSEVTGFHFPMHCELSPLLGQAQLPAVPLSLHHWFLSRSKIMSNPYSPSLMLQCLTFSCTSSTWQHSRSTPPLGEATVTPQSESRGTLFNSGLEAQLPPSLHSASSG